MATKTAARKTADVELPEPQPEPDATPEPGQTPEATPEPAKQAKPTATLDLNPVPVTYYRPAVRVGNDTYTCPHTTWGHESERSAMVCARKLASDHGAVLAKPEAPKAS